MSIHAPRLPIIPPAFIKEFTSDELNKLLLDAICADQQERLRKRKYRWNTDLTNYRKECVEVTAAELPDGPLKMWQVEYQERLQQKVIREYWEQKALPGSHPYLVQEKTPAFGKLYVIGDEQPPYGRTQAEAIIRAWNEINKQDGTIAHDRYGVPVGSGDYVHYVAVLEDYIQKVGVSRQMYGMMMGYSRASSGVLMHQHMYERCGPRPNLEFINRFFNALPLELRNSFVRNMCRTHVYFIHASRWQDYFAYNSYDPSPDKIVADLPGEIRTIVKKYVDGMRKSEVDLAALMGVDQATVKRMIHSREGRIKMPTLRKLLLAMRSCYMTKWADAFVKELGEQTGVWIEKLSPKEELK